MCNFHKFFIDALSKSNNIVIFTFQKITCKVKNN